MSGAADIPLESIADFCRRWGVARLWLFGSLASGREHTESDADILVEFLPGSSASTWDWPAMTDELTTMFARRVDLHSTGILRNPHRRASISASRKLVYAA